MGLASIFILNKHNILESRLLHGFINLTTNYFLDSAQNFIVLLYGKVVSPITFIKSLNPIVNHVFMILKQEG